MWKFKNTQGLENFLLTTLGTDMQLPSADENKMVFFQNGDKMTIDLFTGDLLWEPIAPGTMFTSKLSLRLHQWYSMGLIIPI